VPFRQKPQKALVINALGRVVMEIDLTEKIQAIQIQKLLPGFYRLQTDGRGLGFVKD
jgi:hypothetical protein